LDQEEGQVVVNNGFCSLVIRNKQELDHKKSLEQEVQEQVDQEEEEKTAVEVPVKEMA